MAQRPWEIWVKVAEQYLKFLIKQKGIGRGTMMVKQRLDEERR